MFEQSNSIEMDPKYEYNGRDLVTIGEKNSRKVEPRSGGYLSSKRRVLGEINRTKRECLDQGLV